MCTIQTRVCTNSAVAHTEATGKLVHTVDSDVHKLRRQTDLCTLQACAHYKLVHTADSDVLQPDTPVPCTQHNRGYSPFQSVVSVVLCLGTCCRGGKQEQDGMNIIFQTNCI